MNQNDYLTKNYPLPWTCDVIVQKPTATCHHFTRTWIAKAANGRRVWWTQETVKAICETMNATRG